MTAVRADTPACERITFLNSAGASLMPRPVVKALHDYIDLEAALGGYAAAACSSELLGELYTGIATLIAADEDEIAFFESATAAWQMAFYSVPLQAGDIVLTSEAEYGANYVALLQRKQQIGIEIQVVPSDPDTGALDLIAMRRMMTSRVKLVSLTWIPTNGGLVNPAQAVGALAREFGVPYLLDACQAVGQLPVNVAELGCDMLTATGRKFLRGPRGTGFLYVRRAYMPSLVPHTVDHSSARWVDADTFALRTDARRYELWESNYAARVGLAAAIAYANTLGIAQISARALALARSLRARLAAIPGVTVRDLGPDPCAIVTFTLARHDAAAWVASAAAAGIAMSVSAPSSTWLDADRRGLPDLVRASPHYFNTEAELDVLARFVHASATS